MIENCKIDFTDSKIQTHFEIFIFANLETSQPTDYLIEFVEERNHLVHSKLKLCNSLYSVLSKDNHSSIFIPCLRTL